MGKPNGLWYLDPDPRPRGRVFKGFDRWIATTSTFKANLGMRVTGLNTAKAFDTLEEAYAWSVEQAGRTDG